jgi:S-DNA-T family DNA segregation ATPase FtsK/SpoIIIE
MVVKMPARSKKPSKAGQGGKRPARGGREKKSIPRNLREIYGVTAITLSVLLFLAIYFGSLGPVGRGLEWFFSYLLGRMRYVLPFVLIALGIALITGRLGGFPPEGKGQWRITWVELSGMTVLILGIGAAMHLRVGGPESMFVRENLFSGGGILGAVIAWPLVRMMGRAGAYVWVVGMIIVGFLLLTGLTVSQYFQDKVDRRRRERQGKRAQAAAGQPETRKREKATPGGEPRKKILPKARPAIKGESPAAAIQPIPPLAQPEPPSPVLVEEETGQMAIEIREAEKGQVYRLPPLELLSRVSDRNSISRKSVNESISILEKTLNDFGVDAAVTRVTRGPTVTRFEVELGSGVKVNRVLNLSDDIAYALASPDIRIITPIPGKSAIGIEIPNRERDLVTLGDILTSPRARRMASPLRVGLGKDVSGQPVMVDLREMPHLLLAGATGTGKSCCINAMVTSVLFSAPPRDVRMLMVDPKYVELSHFNGIPHLLTPVITDPKKASGALGWVVKEMEHRFKILSRAGVKSIVAYHAAFKEGLDKEVDEKGEKLFEHMPYILVVIDELADLMMVAPAEVEDSITRIAQMARAVGIHLVVATQRPSVDVVTGMIKANMPSRIAFTVASQADSRVILDTGGAEKLVGHGDMLFLPAGSSKPIRVQGAYISEREITAVTAFIKRQKNAEYEEEILKESGIERKEHLHDDELLEEAMDIVVRSGVASASLLQRKLRIGYARAARLVDLMEEMGVVGGYEGSKPRAVLMTPDELEARKRKESIKAKEGQG